MNTEYLMGQLDELSAHEALVILATDFHRGNVIVKFVHSRREYRIKDMLEWKHLSSVKANKFGPIWIWGGPPKSRTWYEGTFATMVADAILCSHLVDGNYADLIYERNSGACPF